MVTVLFKEFINYQVASVLLEIRGNFKWPEFKNLQTLDQQLQYAQNNLQELGRGSSRAAFLLSNRYVLKIALPSAVEKGIGQNKGEVAVFTNTASKDLVTKIYDFDPKGHWIVSEIARPITNPEEFQQLTGIPWQEFVSVNTNWDQIDDEVQELQNAIKIWTRKVNVTQQQNNQEALQAASQKLQNLQNKLQSLQSTVNNPFLLKVRNLYKQANLVGGDILELDHWGKTADGNIVLIDYGFTRDLAHLYKKSA